MVCIALVGAGNIADRHMAAYEQIDRARVKWVIDVNEETAVRKAAAIGAEASRSLADALRDPEVDVVDVCVPTHLHRETVERCARSKKHVICEKPIALSVRDAEAMFDVCREENVSLFAAHVCRFMRPYREIKRLVDQNELGKVRMVRLTRAINHPARSGMSWYRNAERSGGAFLDFLIHDFDLVRWIFGPADVISSRRTASEQMEGLEVLMQTERDVLVRLEGLWAAVGYRDLHQRAEIDADRGCVRYDNRLTVPWLWEKSDGSAETLDDEQNDPYREELHHFLECIAGRSALIVERDEVLSALRTACEAKRIAR